MSVLAASRLAQRCPAHILNHARTVSVCARGLSASAAAKSTSSSLDSAPRLPTRPVPDAPPALASSPEAFLEYLRSPTAAPFVLRAAHPHPPPDPQALLRTLRAAPNRLVDVELRAGPDAGVDRYEVPLRMYVDWLTASPEERRTMAGEAQLYLAQWRARDEVPGLAEVVRAPSLLAPLIEEEAVDLYQTGFFVGPSATVTPLHYDPYFNLYNVYASSEPSVHAKHFVLLPPTLSEYLARGDLSVMRNMSPINLHILRDGSAPFEVAFDPSTPSRTTEALAASGAAMSCVLREGDTLFVPRRWWHRVESVKLRDTGSPADSGWMAGIGWWFLPRNS
ncbi:Clavaminate synthase-like protein [Trametes cingulata]|nr:Clavaminate synthase-like protein [Trametes cingulata]